MIAEIQYGTYHQLTGTKKEKEQKLLLRKFQVWLFEKRKTNSISTKDAEDFMLLEKEARK